MVYRLQFVDRCLQSISILSTTLFSISQTTSPGHVNQLMHYYYQIIFTNCGTNVKYIARIPKDRSECYEAALRPVRFASICYEEHFDTDHSLPVGPLSRIFISCLGKLVSLGYLKPPGLQFI